ncbi:MAG: hypothetical protein Satyrvirus22_4 [Satyrvirus sp.]|uniref:Uncharacterized protein n=1 Tax=Satyrvirus sp. TaxID=2487771 RepID=A0A3G5AED1_9VIRU|nr:MAG: hypothetical protein Satyrvirus22_4 [Satyrvirus sp.]
METSSVDNKPIFSCSILTYDNLSNFDPDAYFKEYHHHEAYDPTKEYQHQLYQMDYGKGMHTYENKLYTIAHTVRGANISDQNYVIAEERLSEEDIKMLLPYCQCAYHTKSSFNPLKALTCQCCVGCIDSFFPQQYVINKTRDFIEKHKENSCSTSQCAII